MPKSIALVLAAAFVAGITDARSVCAQSWNDSTTRALVDRAAERRAQQLSDSGLIDYTAHAHGYVTFLAQVGDGFLLPPKIVKADELALEVYWRAPNYSKQWIVGRRDTLLLPTDIQYHRDHLGIVQNNFPAIIRLGDGDEVRDVPHPLSAQGLSLYDFAISDSLRFEIPGRVIEMYEVKVRPRDGSTPAAVGALYIAKDDAQVVRMAFSFTRAALKDTQLEDVSVVLENSLIEGRFWLPRRQEIEIRRTGSWMDFPVRGIIRGRWEIASYTVNQGGGGAVAASPGPEIVVAPANRRALHRWPPTPILDSLPPDVRVATDADVRHVQEEARRLVRAQALARTRNTLPSARAISDLARVNRAEGLSLGAGVRRRFGAGFDAALTGRYGLSDHEPKGSLSFGWQGASGVGLEARVFREYRDAGDDAETSRGRNTIAAQEFGSDYTEPYDARGAMLSLRLGATGALRWSLAAGWEWQDSVSVTARPARGAYEPTIRASRGNGPRLALRFDRSPGAWWFGSELRARGELRLGSLRLDGPAATPAPSTGRTTSSFARVYFSIEAERAFAGSRLVAGVSGGTLSSGTNGLPQELMYAGGPISAPGYAFHQLVGERLATQRLEWRFPVPFVPISLGRWGKVPARAQLAPFVGSVYVAPGDAPNTTRRGWYQFAGVGLLTFFDLLRFDVARGTHDGRWTFGVDVTRDFWPIF